MTLFRLDDAVADVYGDLRLEPVLKRLLQHSRRLTGSAAGSVSLIDAGRGRYVKAAEFGASCHLGHSFPLDEGATGRAYGSRRPVVIPDYGRLRGGHLAGSDPARRGPAAAVPIWWRGDVIAVNVAFTGLSARAVDDFDALTQSAAAAIVASARDEPAPALTPQPTDPFTSRESEVLELLRQGLTYREIAARLGLSPKTVDKHVASVLRKTGTSNRTAAVVTALRRRWLAS